MYLFGILVPILFIDRYRQFTRVSTIKIGCYNNVRTERLQLINDLVDFEITRAKKSPKA